MLLNLAGNAIKFTETGGVGVIVEAGADSGEIVFEVRDTGIGIAPEQQARIFHEFEQADGGSARKFGGTGLGLAISRRIVERMGGRIEVDSTPGEGSIFRATVPLPPAEAADSGSVAPPDLASLAVLIVAPASVEASLIERHLTRWGAGAMHLAPHLADMFARAALGRGAGRSFDRRRRRGARRRRSPTRGGSFSSRRASATGCRRSRRQASPAIW